MIEKVRQLTQCDRRITIVELEQKVGISHGTINAILSDDLKMRRVSAVCSEADDHGSDGMSHDGRWRSV
jgi:DNA-binding Xre family transcriptional regulator